MDARETPSPVRQNDRVNIVVSRPISPSFRPERFTSSSPCPEEPPDDVVSPVFMSNSADPGKSGGGGGGHTTNNPGRRDEGGEGDPLEHRLRPGYGTVYSPEFKFQPAGGGEKKEHLYKILVIGELGTGKTSIIKRYVHQFFSQHYRATIGVDFALKVLNWDADTLIRLQLWDIAGQERFGNMTRVYYKEAVGAFVVFDVTRASTFDAVNKWKNDLDSKVQLPDGSPVPCVLLANKCDQAKEGLVNNTNQMDEFCKEKGFIGWYETSAKENINIDEAARFLVTKILEKDRAMLFGDEMADKDRILLDKTLTNSTDRKINCC